MLIERTVVMEKPNILCFMFQYKILYFYFIKAFKGYFCNIYVIK